MTFLSGLFLAALPLVVVPVLIHLIRGRQRDVIAWGAMQFLANAVTKGRRMEKLEELLLMALRVGAVLAVVLALARPMMRSSWWGASSAEEVVLIVDNSLSMSRIVGDITAADQLKGNARELIDDLSSDAEVHIMLAAGGGQWLTAEGVAASNSGKDRLLAMLENVKPTLGTADLLDCLQRVVLMDTEGNSGSRRIVVLTDNQARSWQVDSQSSWQKLGAAQSDAAVPTAIEVVDCGLTDAELNNLAVMRLEASRKIVRPSESIDLSAQVTNVGHVASELLKVEWLVDEEVVATTQLEPLPPNQSTQHGTTLRLDDPGSFAISCRIEAADQIALDQQGCVVVEVSDQIPILLVHDPQRSELAITADELFTTALGYVHGQEQSWHSIYRPQVIASAKLSTAKLSNYRCIVITNLAEFSADAIEHLKRFVTAGGGLWMALGDRIDRESFNRDWYDDGNGPSPLSAELLNKINDATDPASTIHPPSREHPATAQLANTTQLDIDEARILQHWQLAGDGIARGEISVLLESGDGSPLVVENYVGQGRVLVQAFPLGLQWTNFPQLKSYVVMIHDWLDYLTLGATARANLAPGSSIVASTPPHATFASATLAAPDGNEMTLVAQNAEGATTLRYAQTQLPGLYRVNFKTGNETIASLPYYVSRDAAESQLRVLDEQEQSKLVAAADLRFDAEGIAVTQLAQSAPREKPLWGFLLLTLVALLAGELLLSSWLARHRGGVAVSTI